MAALLGLLTVLAILSTSCGGYTPGTTHAAASGMPVTIFPRVTRGQTGLIVLPPVGTPGAPTPQPDTTPGQPVATIAVSEADFTLTLSQDVAPPGLIVFNVQNSGPSPHQFVIIRTDLGAGDLPLEAAVVDTTATDVNVVYTETAFPANTTKTIQVNLAPGHYAIISNATGDYPFGMQADFLVDSGAGPTLAAATILAGIPGPSKTPPSPTPIPVEIMVEDNLLYLDRSMVDPGQILFTLNNMSSNPHDIVFVKTDLDPGGLPVKNNQVDLTSSQLQKLAEQSVQMMAVHQEVTLTLASGNYVILDNQPGNYQKGMYLGLTVDEPATLVARPTVTAPSPTQSSSSSAAFTTTVHVLLKNFSVSLSRNWAPAGGNIVFYVHNLGPDEHEFVIFLTNLRPDSLPVQGPKIVEDAAPFLFHIDEHSLFPAGNTVSLTEQLDTGHYVLVCDLPGHYKKGMHIGFTVGNPSPPYPGPTPVGTPLPPPMPLGTPSPVTTFGPSGPPQPTNTPIPTPQVTAGPGTPAPTGETPASNLTPGALPTPASTVPPQTPPSPLSLNGVLPGARGRICSRFILVL